MCLLNIQFPILIIDRQLINGNTNKKVKVRYDRQLRRRAYRIKPAIHYRSLGDWFENFEITSSKVVKADYQVLIMKQIGNYRKLIIIVNSCLYGCYEASWAYRKNLSQVQQHRLRLDSQQGQILDATCKKKMIRRTWIVRAKKIESATKKPRKLVGVKVRVR